MPKAGKTSSRKVMPGCGGLYILLSFIIASVKAQL
jgi:UDP-N-acetylmuramyl pentapeptide phosphotransferase/UDP-N-acetylglucosamine-1-phosphate transferase